VAVFFASVVANEEFANLFMFAAFAGYRFTKAKNEDTQESVLNEKKESQEKYCQVIEKHKSISLGNLPFIEFVTIEHN
jgi:hypothetical protein